MSRRRRSEGARIVGWSLAYAGGAAMYAAAILPLVGRVTGREAWGVALVGLAVYTVGCALVALVTARRWRR